MLLETNVKGVKNDFGKPPLALLPFDALEDVARVLAHGADKYGAYNWRYGLSWSRVLSAAFRHLFAWARGHDCDPETGISHLAHAACSVLFLLSYTKDQRYADFDDRWLDTTGGNR